MSFRAPSHPNHSRILQHFLLQLQIPGGADGGGNFPKLRGSGNVLVRLPHPRALPDLPLLSSIPVSRPQTPPEELKALLGSVQRLNETFRDLQLLHPLPKGDLLEHLWRLQDLLQNHSDSLLRLTGSLQRLQGLLWSLQSQAGQTERAVARLWDSLSQQSDAAQLELSRLSVDANSSRLLLEHHQHLLGHLGGRLEGLGEQVAALGGAVDSMNRSFSYDVRVQHSRLRDLQGLLGNASADARWMRTAHAAMEQQLRLELAVLNNVTEELRLKDWEHSVALRNISVIRGERESGGSGDGPLWSLGCVWDWESGGELWSCWGWKSALRSWSLITTSDPCVPKSRWILIPPGVGTPNPPGPVPILHSPFQEGIVPKI